MRIPFQIFDHHKYRSGYVWCVRCKDWIPFKAAFGGMVDPHVDDHIKVWRASNKRSTMNLKQTHALQLIERSWESYQSPNPELQTDKGWFPIQDNPADHRPLDVDEALRRSYHTVIVLGNSKVPRWRKLLRLLKR